MILSPPVTSPPFARANIVRVIIKPYKYGLKRASAASTWIWDRSTVRSEAVVSYGKNQIYTTARQRKQLITYHDFFAVYSDGRHENLIDLAKKGHSVIINTTNTVTWPSPDDGTARTNFWIANDYYTATNNQNVAANAEVSVKKDRDTASLYDGTTKVGCFMYTSDYMLNTTYGNKSQTCTINTVRIDDQVFVPYFNRGFSDEVAHPEIKIAANNSELQLLRYYGRSTQKEWCYFYKEPGGEAIFGITLFGRSFMKTISGVSTDQYGPHITPILVGKTADSVKFTVRPGSPQQPRTPITSAESFTYNGETYYVSGVDTGYDAAAYPMQNSSLDNFTPYNDTVDLRGQLPFIMTESTRIEDQVPPIDNVLLKASLVSAAEKLLDFYYHG